MPGEPAYRSLTLSDVERAAQVVSEAFRDDPLCTFMLPLRRMRGTTLKKFFRAYGQVNIQNGRGFGVGDPLQGVAYWQFPDQPELSIGLKSVGKFLPLLFTLYPIGMFRARAVLRQIDALHEKYAPGQHFYLDNLAVIPSARGQGLASRLMRPVLDLADAQKTVAYTDTVTQANVPFYAHFGFQCVEESAVPGTGLTVYALRRPVH